MKLVNVLLVAYIEFSVLVHVDVYNISCILSLFKLIRSFRPFEDIVIFFSRAE